MDDDALIVTLELAVPLQLAAIAGLPFAERRRIARESARVIGTQGDTLMFGSQAKFGHGGAEMTAHRLHAPCVTPATRDEYIRKCRVCARGQASYSAGEVFNFLARGLAVLACQPGGVTYAGRHWCASPHPGCPRSASRS